MTEKVFGKVQDIAVVGMAFRFPAGIDSCKKLWDFMSQGNCAISEIPADRWPTDLYQDPDKNIPGRSKNFCAGVLERIRDFDASFFGISPREAEWLDPQQRILLETVYECMEDAGIRPSLLKGTQCGVYTGISSLDYGLQAPADLPSISAYTMTGNTFSLASNRISYVFDLHGPSISMDTACSSSLVTLHQACQDLRSGRVSCALVCGVHLLQNPYSFIGFSKASMLSPTGTCHPFAADANGYVRSEGCAVLLIKPLEDAVRDKNRIYGVIKASGVNTDGARKKGLTIPSQEAQAELMTRVLKDSGLSFSDFDYVEVHGTGTPVGDPVEAASVSKVYGNKVPGPEGENINSGCFEKSLPISSAKGYLGHMEPVSGLASFIKAVLCLGHKALPPVPFAFTPNPNIDFDDLGVFCPAQGISLAKEGRKTCTAGVNSFGFGGANAHVILQWRDWDCMSFANSDEDLVKTPQFDNDREKSCEPVALSGKNVAEEITTPSFQENLQGFFLSAESRDSLKGLACAYGSFLVDNPVKNIADLSQAVLQKRDLFTHRLAVLCSREEELVSALLDFARNGESSQVITSVVKKPYKKIAFVFNGNGAQYLGMGRDLYNESKVFKSVIDDLSPDIASYIGISVKDIISGAVADDPEFIRCTRIAQPMIFSIQVGIAEVLKSYGIVPEMTCGHSMGEIAAVYVAGKLSRSEAIKVICIRSMLQDRSRDQGRMAVVSLSPQDFAGVTKDLGVANVAVAAFNSADNITISGDISSLEILGRYFREHHIFFKLLDVDYPFHSSFMDEIHQDVLQELKDIGECSPDGRSEGETVFYSTVYGRRLQDGENLNSEYWWHNIRDQVLFAPAVTAVAGDGADYILEIGPDAILQRYLRDALKSVSSSDHRQGAVITDSNSSTSLPVVKAALSRKNTHFRQLMEVVLDNLNQFQKLSDIQNSADGDVSSPNAYVPDVSTVSDLSVEKDVFYDLPHYVWDRKYFALSPSTEKAPEQRREAPLLGWRIPSADLTWENILEPSKNPLIRDHQVEDNFVYAGASYLETLLECARSLDQSSGKAVQKDGNDASISESETNNNFIAKNDSGVTNTGYGLNKKCSGSDKNITVKVNNNCPSLDEHSWINLEGVDILAPLSMENLSDYKSLRCRILPLTRSAVILSRSYLSKDPWQEHVRCRILPGNSPELYVDLAPDSWGDSKLHTISSRELYDLARTSGLGYGENFRLVDKVICAVDAGIFRVDLKSAVWESDAKAKGKTGITIESDSQFAAGTAENDWISGDRSDISSRLVIHPGILDAAFQGLIGLLSALGNSDTCAYLPVKFDGVGVRQNVCPTFIMGRLKSQGKRSVLADFRFFDADGICVAVIRDARFKKLPGKANYLSSEPSLYHYEIKPAWHNEINSPDGNEVLDSLLACLKNSDVSEEEADPADTRKLWFTEVMPLIEQAVLSYCFTAFWNISCSSSNDKVGEIFRARLNQGTLPPYISYFLDLLISQNLIARDDKDELHFTEPEVTGTEALAYAYRRLPSALPEILPVYRIGIILEDIFREMLTCSASQDEGYIDSNKGLSDPNRLVSGTVDFSHYIPEPNLRSVLYTGMSKALTALVRFISGKAEDCNSAIRAVEFGGSCLLREASGLSGKSHLVQIFEVADEDISSEKLFTDQALEKIARDDENLDHDKFDLIVINNLLHKVPDMRLLLEDLKKHLVSGGVVAVIERNQDWCVDFVQGLNENWWRYSPVLHLQDRKSSSVISPLQSADVWESIISQELGSAAVYTEPASLNIRAGLSLVLGQNQDNVLSDMLLSESEGDSIASENIRTDDNDKSTVVLVVTESLFKAINADQSSVSAESGVVALAESLWLKICEEAEDHHYQVKLVCSNNDTFLKGMMSCERENTNSLTGKLKVVFLSSSGWDISSDLNDHSENEPALSVVLAQLSSLSTNLNSLLTSEQNLPTAEKPAVQLYVVASGGLNIPEQRGIWGVARVIRNEYSQLNVTVVDAESSDALRLLSSGNSFASASEFCTDSTADSVSSGFSRELFRKEAEDLASGLIREIFSPDGLDEVILGSAYRGRPVIRGSVDPVNGEFLPYRNKSPSSHRRDDNSSVLSESYRNFGKDLPLFTRTLDFTAPGRLRNLIWKKSPVNSPAEGEVLVEVAYTGLNFRDVMMTMGLVPDDVLEKGFSGPYLGLEFSGVVLRVGEGVTRVVPGDRVMGFGSSSFSDLLTVPDFAVAKVPETWSLAEASSVPIVFFTAWYAITVLARMEKGESLLIHGAAGGVGIAAIQIASYLGLKVYATVGSPEKQDFLRMLGIEHIYNSRDLSFREAILRDTCGVGVDAVLNCLSGEAMRESLRVLKPFGRFMELGKRDFVENSDLGMRALRENISYFAIDADQLIKFSPEKSFSLFNQVVDLFKQGVLYPLPYTVFSSDDVLQAFQYMQQGCQIGKVVINHLRPVQKFNNNRNAELDKSLTYKLNNHENDVSAVADHAVDHKALFRKEDTWLVTGGTRGFGFACALYLLDQGVGNVVLVSRSGLKDPELREILDTRYKDRAVVKCCDVSDFNQVQSLWQRLQEQRMQITGIVNAAAVFKDRLLKDLQEEDFREVWQAKYQSALNMHKVSFQSPLKYFVVFSSISSAVGNVGQANYVAANIALESLIEQRCSQNLPGLAIEWGPVGDVGFLSSQKQVKSSLESALGYEALKSCDALSVLPKLLKKNGTFIVANVSWQAVDESFGVMSHRFYSLARSEGKSGKVKDSSLASQINGKSRNEAVDLVVKMLIGEIAETMGFGPDQVKADDNLQALGLDSLMAMDLLVSIEKQTGIRFSVMTLQDSPTVRKLAEKILDRMNTRSSDQENNSQKGSSSVSDVNSYEKDLVSGSEAESKSESETDLSRNRVVQEVLHIHGGAEELERLQEDLQELQEEQCKAGRNDKSDDPNDNESGEYLNGN